MYATVFVHPCPARLLAGAQACAQGVSCMQQQLLLWCMACYGMQALLRVCSLCVCGSRECRGVCCMGACCMSASIKAALFG